MSQSEPHVCTAGSNLLKVSEHDCTHEIAIIALFTGPLSAFHRLQYIENLEMSTAKLYTIMYVPMQCPNSKFFFSPVKKYRINRRLDSYTAFIISVQSIKTTEPA